MAMNWQTFRVRALSALLFVAIMLTGLLWNEWSFFILFSIIHIGCWIEYQKLIQQIDARTQKGGLYRVAANLLSGWGMMFILASALQLQLPVCLTLIGNSLLVAGLVSYCINELLNYRHFYIKNIFYSLFGLIYLSLSLALLLNIRSGMMWLLKVDLELAAPVSDSIVNNTGFYIPLIIIGSIWVNDTMAYIVGSFIGKTPFSKISPKKTWEGTIGGIVLAVLIIWLIDFFILKQSSIHTPAIAAIASVAGTIGDLFESKLKRMAGVKDSGAILPGHGGFLDRFDSLLFAIPAVWLYLFLAGCF
jgi:phosphatidate cytidylyltransferase